ncbi:MAG: hypothetical protein QOE40_1277, partial [Actinomycetota bacterium]|nr:hypothetical protein [Actinomycetota bacterium]
MHSGRLTPGLRRLECRARPFLAHTTGSPDCLVLSSGPRRGGTPSRALTRS